jgi:5'-nucleotidase
VPNLEKLAAQCNFPWLLSNVFDTTTQAPLAKGKEYVIVERAGLKIGVIGLVER